jgi:FlaA1/EpsC-like NDP-sugar epimerase
MKLSSVQKSSPVLTGLRVRYLMAVDFALILIAGVFAFVIRYEALISVWPYLQQNWIYFVLAPLMRLPVYYSFRLYNRMWRYASVVEMKMIVLAGFVSSFLIFILNFGLLPLMGVAYMPSRSIWLLEGLLSLGALAGSRFLLRLLQERYRPHELLKLRAFIIDCGRWRRRRDGAARNSEQPLAWTSGCWLCR